MDPLISLSGKVRLWLVGRTFSLCFQKPFDSPLVLSSTFSPSLYKLISAAAFIGHRVETLEHIADILRIPLKDAELLPGLLAENDKLSFLTPPVAIQDWNLFSISTPHSHSSLLS